MKKPKLLIVIPARSGSTRIKNKNIRKIGSKSLLELKIKTCLKVKNARIIVSTNSKSIAKIATSFGAEVPYLRPNKYSTPTSSTLACVLDLLRFLKKNNNEIPEFVGIFPPTNPFLRSNTIDRGFKQLIKNKKKFNSIVGYTQATDHPYLYISNLKSKIKFNLLRYMNTKYSDFERTQDWPKAFIASASLKIVKTSFLMKYINNFSSKINKKTFDINNSAGIKISTFENFDINHELDLKIANSINEILGKKYLHHTKKI